MENDTKKEVNIDLEKVKIIPSAIKPLGELDSAIDPKTGLEVNIKDVRERVDFARGNVHDQNPCFGALIEHINIIYTFDVPTQATDGTRLFVNPTWTNILTDGEIRFVMIHELLHCVLCHMKRGQGHDRRLANIAADYEVNGAAFIDKFVNQGQLDHIGGCFSKKYLKNENTNEDDLWAYEMIYKDILEHPDMKHECPDLDIVWDDSNANSNIEQVPTSDEFKKGFADAMHKINIILEKNYRKMSKRLGESYNNDDVSRALKNASKEIGKIRKKKASDIDFSKLFGCSKKASDMLKSLFNSAKKNGTKVIGVPPMGFISNAPSGVMNFELFKRNKNDNTASSTSEDESGIVDALTKIIENSNSDDELFSKLEELAAQQKPRNYDNFDPTRDIDEKYRTYEQGWDYAVNMSVSEISKLLEQIANSGNKKQNGNGGMPMPKQYAPALGSDFEHLNIPRPPQYQVMVNSGKGGTGDKTKRLSNEDIISQQEGANIARKAGYKGDFVKEESVDEIQAKWDELAKQMAGKEGSELITRRLKDIEASKYNWQHELRKLMNRAMKNSAKFRNEWGEKRGLARDAMTLKHKTNNDSIKDIVFLVDCSGSISDKMLSNLLSECYSISKKCNVYDVTYAYFTTRVELVETTNTRLAGKISDAAVMLLKRSDKHARGGHISGGTDFKNSLDWVNENGGARCVVLFTDGYDEVVPKPKNISNLIWCVYDNPDFKSVDSSRVVHLTTKDLK